MNERFSLVDRQVPYLHEKQIEREARFLLEEYELKFERKVTAPIPLESESIIKGELGLTISLQGRAMVYFSDRHPKFTCTVLLSLWGSRSPHFQCLSEEVRHTDALSPILSY